MYLTIWIFLTKILVLLEGQAVFLLTVIHNGYFFEIFIQEPHGFMASLIIFNVILVINLKKGIFASYQQLLDWKEKRNGEVALLIEGARRIDLSSALHDAFIVNKRSVI